MAHVSKRQSLDTIPDDIVLEIFSFLEADAILALAQVARRFDALSSLYVVWHNAFLNLLHRARYTDLLPIDKKPLKDVDIYELKASVIKASSAEKNWSSETPKAKGLPRTINFANVLETNVSLEQGAYITKFTSKHMLLPMADGGILGWNLKENTPAGTHAMDRDCIIVDLALEKDTKELIGLIGKVAPVRLGMQVRLSVLRIGIPEQDPQPLSFKSSSQITLLIPFTSEVHLLDASRKMLCCVFSCTNSNQMAILVVLDWESEEAVIFNTGLTYDYGRALIGLHLSPDGDFLLLQSDENGSEVRRWYCLADLENSYTTWNALDYESETIFAPAKQEVLKWENDISILYEAKPYLFWSIDQLPAPPYPEIPSRISTIVLYISVPEDVLEPEASDRTWHIAQHYSDKNGPCASMRSIGTLRNPALNPNDPDGIPILCMSFNHFGWIEEVEIDGVKKRTLMLMTFPDPGTGFDGDLAELAKGFDIPSEVLDDAYHLLIDATQGLILVGTMSQTLHVYNY